MGVKQCDRKRCRNIMCDDMLTTRHYQHYICSECRQELHDAVDHHKDDLHSKYDLDAFIDKFMASDKDSMMPPSENFDPCAELDKMF